MYESTDAETGHPDAHYGESEQGSDRPRDERALYGTPCHEVGEGTDEKALYGEPQHETSEDADQPDVDLLLVRMRSEPVSGPTATDARTPPAAGTTER